MDSQSPDTKKIVVSQPFTLNKQDYVSMGIGALLASLGGFFAYWTATALPKLGEAVANQWGALLVALASTATPIIANMIRTFLTTKFHVVDSSEPTPSKTTSASVRVPLLGLLFILGLLLMPVSAFAEGLGITVGGKSIDIMSLLTNPMVMSALVMSALLITSKVFKVDLTKFGPMILALINSVLKPSGPVTPPVVNPPAPVVDPVVNPLDPGTNPVMQMLLMLLQQFLAAKASGNKEQQDAAATMMEKLFPRVAQHLPK